MVFALWIKIPVYMTPLEYRNFLIPGEDPLTQRMLGRLHEDKLSKLMNGPIRKKLQIIPEHVKWGGNLVIVQYTIQSLYHVMFGILKKTYH